MMLLRSANLCYMQSRPLDPLSLAGQVVYFQSSEEPVPVKDGLVNFVITSPPYWNLKDYGHSNQIGGESYERYLSRMNIVWKRCAEVTNDDAVMVINVGNRRHKKVFYPIAFDIVRSMEYWELWDIVIWYIPNALPQPNHYIERLFDNKFEFLLLFTKPGNRSYRFSKPRVPQKYIDNDPRAYKKNPRGRCLGNVIRIPAYKPPNVKQLGYHQAAYPEELVALMLESFTEPGDTVLDPFVGSGTTLKVSRGMNRSGIGIEINSDYRSLIAKRIKEPFETPDWRDLDIIHSTNQEPGQSKPRKIHLLKFDKVADEPLF